MQNRRMAVTIHRFCILHTRCAHGKLPQAELTGDKDGARTLASPGRCVEKIFYNRFTHEARPRHSFVKKKANQLLPFRLSLHIFAMSPTLSPHKDTGASVLEDMIERRLLCSALFLTI